MGLNWIKEYLKAQMHFCLKLLQSSYNPTTKVVTNMFSPHKLTKVSTLPSPAIVNLISSFNSGNSSPIVVHRSTPTPGAVSSASASAPNMDRLLSMLSGLDSEVIYLGPMTFLDFQLDSVKIFELEPTLYGESPCKQEVTNSITNQIQTYVSNCMFYTFLSICKTDYVGVDRKDSAGKMTHKICKKYKYCDGGKNWESTQCYHTLRALW